MKNNTWPYIMNKPDVDDIRDYYPLPTASLRCAPTIFRRASEGAKAIERSREDIAKHHEVLDYVPEKHRHAPRLNASGHSALTMLNC